MTREDTMTKVDPVNPLTEREAAIAELVGEGHSVKETSRRLVARGFHMQPSSVASRIRDVANKIPNPFGLPPMAAIKAWWRGRRAA